MTWKNRHLILFWAGYTAVGAVIRLTSMIVLGVMVTAGTCVVSLTEMRKNGYRNGGRAALGKRTPPQDAGGGDAAV